ncbi:MAG TPA: DUF433 domain-containing protein [Chthonomonadaceae bacterium]|nr:DUF433 domain-containing protein [Chthonomonadaceae bacterium]
MQLDDYFDFLAPDDIRIQGTRIGIESVLLEYLHNARTPEEIAARFRTLTLEQVYATILYYLHNKEQVTAYLTDYLDWVHRTRTEAKEHPSPATQRLTALREEINAFPSKEREAARARIVARERAILSGRGFQKLDTIGPILGGGGIP